MVLQILDLHVGDLRVGPLYEVIFGLVAYDLQVVETDELPDDGQDVLLISFDEIAATDAWNFQAELLAHFRDLAAVDTTLELVVGVLVNSFPVDAARLEFITDLKNDDTSLDILIKVIDVHIFNAQAVDPEAEGALVSATLNIVIDDTSLLIGLFLLLVQLF
jgi:hypothetical protein